MLLNGVRTSSRISLRLQKRIVGGAENGVFVAGFDDIWFPTPEIWMPVWRSFSDSCWE